MLSTLNHRLSNSHTHAAAPLQVPGFYKATRRQFNRQAQEWTWGRFELEQGVVEHRVRFADKTVFVYVNPVYQTELWTFIDRSSGRWLMMRPAEVERTRRYLKAQAARNAQRRAEPKAA